MAQRSRLVKLPPAVTLLASCIPGQAAGTGSLIATARAAVDDPPVGAALIDARRDVLPHLQVGAGLTHLAVGSDYDEIQVRLLAAPSFGVAPGVSSTAT